MLKQIVTCCEDQVKYSNSENNALKPVNYIRNFQYKPFLTIWKKMCI